MKKIIILLLLAVFSINASAFVIDGLEYLTFNGEAEVRVRCTYEYISILKGTVNIPSSVTYDGKTYSVVVISSFQNCRGITNVIIPNSVRTIDDHAFCSCTGLTSVTIPNSVTYIGEDAFDYCI